MISFDSERCMEDFLTDNIDHYRDEFNINGYEIHRQLNLGAYGIADFVATRYTQFDKNTSHLDVCIFELKNTPLTATHVTQISRYKDFFAKMYDRVSTIMDVRGVLIGTKTFPTSDDLCFLCQQIDWLEVYELSLCPVDGVVFKYTQGWAPSKAKHEDYIKVASKLIPQSDVDDQEAANEPQELKLAGIAE